MSGPKPKYKIQLLEKEVSELRQLLRARNSPQVKVMRARIILAAHEHPEWSNQQIAALVGCTDRAVRKWRRRWDECKSIDDLPKPGRPKLFSLRSTRPGNGTGM